jgi:hypothetical protein
VIEGAYVHGYTTAFGIGSLIMVGAFVLVAFVMPRIDPKDGPKSATTH